MSAWILKATSSPNKIKISTFSENVHDRDYFASLRQLCQATEAVRNLEAAGVPHGDISIVSNNSDNWYSADATRTTGGPATIIDRDRDGVDDRAEGAGKGAGIGATAAAWSGY